MAQKPKARSRGSSAKPKARSRSSGSSAKQQKPPAARSKKSNSNGTTRIETVRRAVGDTAKDAGQTVGSAAGKAKVPLLAGGAALAGAAGGLALGARQARRHGALATAFSRRPQVKVGSRDLARAAKEVGTFGAQMGRLASELQQTREAADDGKHRSPLEVVLEGLTARRSRA